MKRPLLLASLLLAVLAAGRAQCPNFTDLNGAGVTCYHGLWESPTTYAEMVPGLHEVITQPGMDPYTNYQLPIIPPGESAVVKLGNDQGGRKSREIRYTYTVNEGNSKLLVKYAVVFKHAGYSHPQGPFLRIIVTDASGYHSIEPCGNYTFDTSPTDGNLSGLYSWVPWRNMVIDLSDHIGQQIAVRFISYDCFYHDNEFSYVYFTASCTGSSLTLLGCDGQNITLSAPSGFPNYLWSNGATTQTTSYPIAGNLNISCKLYSLHGCSPVLDYLDIQGFTLTEGAEYYDTICEGESYSGYGFNLPSQNTPGNYTFSRTVLNPSTCLSGTLYKVHLVVRQRDVHYYASACEGEVFDQYGFHYTNLQAGTFVDSLPLTTENGCVPAYQYLHLTVSRSLANFGELFGESSVCDLNVTTYTLNYPGPIYLYQWEIPEGVTNFTPYPGSNVILYFTGEAPNPAVLSVTGTDACGTHTLTKVVYHSPTYYFVYEDTICTGDSYSGHGIQSPLFEEPGLYYLSQNGTTEAGCDSDVMVRLMVYPSPEVTTLAQPEEICSEENTILLAVGEYGAIVPHSPQLVVPGDIVCTDSTIVKPADWPVPGKTAKAVVYFVDTTGEHGWAVNLHDQGSFPWGNTYLPESSGLSSTIMEPEFALDGKLNTQKLRLYGDAASFPAVWSVDFDHGWYLPAIGQLMLIFHELSTINETLSLVSGDPFTPSPTYEPMASWYYHYWSSTPQQFSQPGSNLPCNPWAFDVFNYMDSSGLPGVALRVRSIIDF